MNSKTSFYSITSSARARGERPCGNSAAEEGEEIAASHADGANCKLVMRGLDPRIHLLAKSFFEE